MIFERNMKILSEFQKPIFEKLQDPVCKVDFPETQVLFGLNEKQAIDNVIINANGQMWISGTEQEGEDWVKYVNPDLHTIIILGFAMGYHIEKLAQKYPDKKIIVIEPDKRILFHAMHVRDLEFVLKHCEIWLEEEINLIKAKIHELITHPLARGIMLIPYMLYCVVYRDYTNDIISSMMKIMNDFAVMVNTKRTLTEKWYINRIENAKVESYHGKCLIDKFKDVPAFLVGAGPSLKGQLDIIKGLQGKAVILAASTAAQILINNGINPTFMVAIDQDPVTSGGLHENLDSNIPLVFDGQVAQNSLKYKGPKIQMLLNVNRYTDMVIPGLPVFESGPSVANVGLDMLHKMGCAPILMVGMDLSYTDNKLYCDGTEFNKDIGTNNMIRILNNKGEECFTEPSFISMRNWFEEYVARVKPANVFNCTERGIPIQGVINLPLSDFIFNKEYDFKLDLELAKSNLDINMELVEELKTTGEFIEKNKHITPEIMQKKSWILVEEFSQSLIYLEEIRCEGRIKKGMDVKESVRIFNEKRVEILKDNIDKLIKILN